MTGDVRQLVSDDHHVVAVGTARGTQSGRLFGPLLWVAALALTVLLLAVGLVIGLLIA